MTKPKQGIDPKVEQKEAQAENSGAYTLETTAREWYVSNKWWSEDHRPRVLRYFELYISPHIGSFDIRQLKISHLYQPRLKKLMRVANMTLRSIFSNMSRPLCDMPYRVITSVLTQPVIWPVRYRQPKRDITPLYSLVGSLSSLHVLLYIVVV